MTGGTTLTNRLLEAAVAFFDFLWQSFLLLAPMLLLGLFLSGLIHVFISRQAVLRWLRHESLKSVTTAAAVGVPIPLCSCSVVPVVAEMRRKGASRSSCMSFLITAPETGADSILVTNAFFGPIVAIVRPVISFITAVFAGIFCIGMIRDGRDDAAAQAADNGHEHGHDHHHGHDHGHDHSHKNLFPGSEDCYVSFSQLKQMTANWFRRCAAALGRWKAATWLRPDFYYTERKAAAASRDAEPDSAGGSEPDLRSVVRHVLRYGFVEIADDILFALLVGIALGGVLYLAIPSEMMANEYARWISYPVMVLVGIPLYICASASTPIAAALVAKGFSPGAALIFLMTGPATNTGTIAIMLAQFGTRFASVYVGSVIAVTVVLGILVDSLLLLSGISIAVNLGASESPAILALQYGGALGLLALIVWRFRAGALKSGWQELVSNVGPLTRPWRRGWNRLTRGRPLAGAVSPATPMGRMFYALIVVGIILSGFTVVPPQSVGYGRVLGRVVWRDLPPGLYWLGPPPIVQADKWPVREVKSFRTAVSSEFVSGDLNVAVIGLDVQFRVSDPYLYHYQTNDAEAVLRGVVLDRLRQFVGARTLEDLLVTQRAALEDYIASGFPYGGHSEPPDADAVHEEVLQAVDIVKVSLRTIRPAAETVAAFRDVSSAQEDRERVIVNAQSFMGRLVPQAHGNAFYEVRRAHGDAYARELGADAQAEALTTISATVRTAPGVLRTMLWREKLESALSGNAKIIVPNADSLEKVALWQNRTPAGSADPASGHGE